MRGARMREARAAAGGRGRRRVCVRPPRPLPLAVSTDEWLATIQNLVFTNLQQPFSEAKSMRCPVAKNLRMSDFGLPLTMVSAR